jgi:hypothetical protein
MWRAGLTLLAALALMLVPATTSSAQPAPQGTNWQAGPGASGDNTFVGAVDTPANGATLPGNRLVPISGWFVDTTAQGWAGVDDAQIFLGTMESGTMLTHASIGLNRPDIASKLGNPYWAASGWSAVLDTGGLPNGQVTLSAYVHTPGKGWWYTQVGFTVGATVPSAPLAFIGGPPVAAGPPLLTVASPLDGESVSTRVAVFKITGTARDPVSGVHGIDWVDVWLNGEQNTDGATFLGEADLAPDGSWSLDMSPWRYTPITSNLYVYAHSDVTSRLALRVVHFIIVDRPL